MSAIFLTKVSVILMYIGIIALNIFTLYSLYMSYKIKKYDSFWFYTILLFEIILIVVQLQLFGIIKITIR